MDRPTKTGCSWIMIQTTTTTTNKKFTPSLLNLPISHTQQLSLKFRILNTQDTTFLVLSKAIFPPHLQLFTLTTHTPSRNHQNLSRQIKNKSFKFKLQRLLNTKLQNDLVRKELTEDADVSF